MNLFLLHWLPKLCARYHCDKHVVKMIIETAQMLSSVHWLRCSEGPYRMTHAKHPVVLWLMESKANYLWTCQLGLELAKEYTYRYGKVHKCESMIQWLVANQPDYNKLTTPAPTPSSTAAALAAPAAVTPKPTASVSSSSSASSSSSSLDGDEDDYSAPFTPLSQSSQSLSASSSSTSTTNAATKAKPRRKTSTSSRPAYRLVSLPIRDPDGTRVPPGVTPFNLCMPDQFKVDAIDPIAAYRHLYVVEKARFCKWTKRPIPAWFRAGTEAINGSTTPKIENDIDDEDDIFEDDETLELKSSSVKREKEEDENENEEVAVDSSTTSSIPIDPKKLQELLIENIDQEEQAVLAEDADHSNPAHSSVNTLLPPKPKAKAKPKPKAKSKAKAQASSSSSTPPTKKKPTSLKASTSSTPSTPSLNSLKISSPSPNPLRKRTRSQSALEAAGTSSFFAPGSSTSSPALRRRKTLAV